MGNQVQRRKPVVVVLSSRNILILARSKVLLALFKFEVLFYQLVHLVMG